MNLINDNSCLCVVSKGVELRVTAINCTKTIFVICRKLSYYNYKTLIFFTMFF